jgi:hypothetical protein
MFDDSQPDQVCSGKPQRRCHQDHLEGNPNGWDTSVNSAKTPGRSPATTPPTLGKNRFSAGLSLYSPLIIYETASSPMPRQRGGAPQQ